MTTSAADLYDGFAVWADAILAQRIPPEVVAFSVNLYEGTDTFDVQITGAPSFDVADPDWPCDVVFSSEENLFGVPRVLVGNRWEAALELVRGWTEKYVKSGTGAAVLRASQGVGVGFVDGDLEIVWSNAVA
jgi:hypothetical protein